MKMKRFVVGKVCVAGVHHWPNAVGYHDYLRNPHRHDFCIEVRVEVQHNDREVEIFALQDEVMRLLKAQYCLVEGRYFDFKTSSCEDIAQYLANALNAVFVEVLEDGNGGAQCCTTM